jgi:hypothetical protein
VSCGAAAALDSLLAAHPVDARGRGRLCRGRGWLGRRRRVCMVFRKAHYWLRHPLGALPAQLARELGIDLLPLPSAADPQNIPVRTGTTVDPSLTPAVPHPLASREFQEAGWSDPGHGGVGVQFPNSPRLRRGPSDNPSPGPGVALLFPDGVTWPS